MSTQNCHWNWIRIVIDNQIQMAWNLNCWWFNLEPLITLAYSLSPTPFPPPLLNNLLVPFFHSLSYFTFFLRLFNLIPSLFLNIVAIFPRLSLSHSLFLALPLSLSLSLPLSLSQKDDLRRSNWKWKPIKFKEVWSKFQLRKSQHEKKISFSNTIV